MLQWISQYWLEVLFGAVVFMLTAFLKKFYEMSKQQEKQKMESFKQDIIDIINDTHAKTVEIIEEKDQKQNDEMLRLAQSLESTNKNFETMKAGILSIQEKVFKERCRDLLANNKKIELEEYENLSHDHYVYNSLGGNHDGDRLFGLVTTKYKNGLDN